MASKPKPKSITTTAKSGAKVEYFVEHDEEDFDEYEMEDGEVFIPSDLLSMRRSKLASIARSEIHASRIPSDFHSLPIWYVRKFLLKQLFEKDTFHDSWFTNVKAGAKEFDDEIAKESDTKDFLMEFLSRDDYPKYIPLLINSIRTLSDLKELGEKIEPMLADTCRLLERNEIAIPETVNDWWQGYKAKDEERVSKRVQELRQQLDDAERAREELDILIGKPKVRVARILKVPRRR